MSRRHADALFLLPEPPREIRVVGGGLAELAAAATAAGIAVREVDPAGHVAPEGATDPVVCRRVAVRAALALGAHAVVVFGRVSRRTAAAAGYETRVFHAWPRNRATRLFVPADERSVGRRLLRDKPAATFASRLRDLALRLVVEVGRAPSVAAVTVCTRGPAAPALVRAITDRRPELDPRRFHLDCGRGDDLQRLVFHVHDVAGPRAVCKFSRVPDNPTPFARDAAGLRLVARHDLTVTRHAPRLVDLGTVAATHYVVETHAPGLPLSNWLDRRPAPPWIAAQIAGITAWIEAMQTQSAAPTGTVARPTGLDAVLLDDATRATIERSLARVPRVLGHNDLGCWNILSTPRGFTVVDWEGATAAAPPLWDLWYFLADVHGRLAERVSIERRIRHTGNVFAGRDPHSAALFAATRRLSEALGVERRDLGPLLAACWLAHGASREARHAAVNALGDTPAPIDHLSQLWRVWPDDPDLGVTWPAFDRFVSG